ncbi:hypothetical protein B0T17DRAFT_509930 [Bombardia bombarda]|uniref:PX domain-containing protein n=1 Tax=Bombardia bombarda TaxID=252184 RepID=A0AA39WN36_9PEZI|nr:hypothetical protein B0T17DRAFT_509930 [Bombardia bombarda]
MQIKSPQDALIPSKPQLHSRKYHHTYNGTRQLPIATWVQPLSSSSSYPPTTSDQDGSSHDSAPLSSYEVELYYERNRACTIYRSWDDFVTLRNGLTMWPNAPPLCPDEEQHYAQEQEQLQLQPIHDQNHSHYLHRFLWEALGKWPHECAVEYFLRRRIGDCGGR